jgi:hypothetical protein
MVDLTPQQREMIDLIEREFVNAGLSRYWAAGAVANAMKESKFDPNKTFYGKDYKKTGIKTENSVGLFMLNSMGSGLGTGMPQGPQYPDGDSRKDPVLNTKRIIRAIKNLKKAREEFDSHGKDIAEIAASFTKWIENPKDLKKEQDERKVIARAMFPNGIEGLIPMSGALAPPGSLPLSQPEKETGLAPVKSEEDDPWKKWILLGIAASVVGLVYTAKVRYDKRGKKPWQL